LGTGRPRPNENILIRTSKNPILSECCTFSNVECIIFPAPEAFPEGVWLRGSDERGSRISFASQHGFSSAHRSCPWHSIAHAVAQISKGPALRSSLPKPLALCPKGARHEWHRRSGILQNRLFRRHGSI